MEILLNGLGSLPAETHVKDRLYHIEKEGFSSSEKHPRFVVSFNIANGTLLQIYFIDDLAEERTTTLIQVVIDHVKVLDQFGTWAYFIDTTDLPDMRLRKFVEQALKDLIAEEKRQDPTGRHGRRQRLTQEQLERQAEMHLLFEKLGDTPKG
jgi:hypothetical protein